MFNESYLAPYDPTATCPKIIFADYKRWAAGKAAHDLTDREAVLTWALGLVCEASEAREAYYRAAQTNDSPGPAALAELGDVLWYAAVLAHQCRVSGLTFPQGRPATGFPPDVYLDGVGERARSAGELIKKSVSHGHGYPLNAAAQTQLHQDLQAVIGFIARAAAKLGSSLDAVARSNMDKLDARYPDGFSTEASVNRIND